MSEEPQLDGNSDAGVISTPETGRRPTGARSIMRGSMWQLLGQLTPLVINLALTPYIISGLGKRVYGVFLVVVAVQLFIAALDGGLASSAARYFSILAGSGDKKGMTRLLTTVVGMATVTSTVIIVGTFIWAPNLMRLFPDTAVDFGGAVFLIRMLAVIIGISQLRGAFQQVVFSHGTFGWNSLSSMMGHAIYVTGMLLTIHNHWGLHGIAWTQLAQQIAPTVLIMPQALRYLDHREFHFTDRATTIEFLRYAWKVQLSSIMDVIGSQGDTMLVGHFAAPQVTPFGTGNNFATTLGNVPMNANVPIQTAVGHHIGSLPIEAAAERTSRVQAVWVQAIVGWVAVGAPAAYYGVNDWLNLGSDLTGKVSALVLLSFGMLLMAQVLLLWANGVGHSEVPLAYGLTSTVVNLVLTVILIVPFGAMGSVTATFVGRVVSTIVLAVLMARRLPTRITSPWRQVPWVAAVAGAAWSAAGSMLVSHFLVGGIVPHGPLALLTCGLAAAPGMLVYAYAVLGREGIGSLVNKVRHRG